MLEWDSKSALVVVDVQNDFADPGGSLYVPGGDAILATLNRLVVTAESSGAMVAYTKDWHPPNTPHFEKDGGIWPVHCVRNSWGACLHPGLARAGASIVVHKGQGGEDGYSAFTVVDPTNGERCDTGFERVLRRLTVDRVVVAGLATDYCVRATALDALERGFLTFVVCNAVRAVDRVAGDGDRALAELAAAGVELIGDGGS